MSTSPSSTATSTAAATTTWAIDPAHTLAEFQVRHLMISTVKGRFADVKGTVVSHDVDPAKGSVDIVIAANSIDTREPQRDAHLRSADFLDADNFPTLEFRSTRIENVTNEGHFTLVGDLTIHGTTKEVALAVTSEGRVKDPWGGERAGFSATTKIRRSDFGLTWNVLLETGGVTVGDEVKIALEVELIKQA
jgi:polyisoprenoid-binding protein YceI